MKTVLVHWSDYSPGPAAQGLNDEIKKQESEGYSVPPGSIVEHYVEAPRLDAHPVRTKYTFFVTMQKEVDPSGGLQHPH